MFLTGLNKSCDLDSIPSPLGWAGTAPDLITQHQWLTLVMFLWPHGGKFLHPSWEVLSKRGERERLSVGWGYKLCPQTTVLFAYKRWQNRDYAHVANICFGRLFCAMPRWCWRQEFRITGLHLNRCLVLKRTAAKFPLYVSHSPACFCFQTSQWEQPWKARTQTPFRACPQFWVPSYSSESRVTVREPKFMLYDLSEQRAPHSVRAADLQERGKGLW